MGKKCKTRMSGRVAVLLVVLTAWACAGTGKDPAEPVTKTHYTLRKGDVVPYPEPLPNGTPVYVDWHLSNGGKETTEGFRGWDFDGDGTFEMVDVLAKDGPPMTRVFDFDGDGRIDWRRDAGKTGELPEGLVPAH